MSHDIQYFPFNTFTVVDYDEEEINFWIVEIMNIYQELVHKIRRALVVLSIIYLVVLSLQDMKRISLAVLGHQSHSQLQNDLTGWIEISFSTLIHMFQSPLIFLYLRVKKVLLQTCCFLNTASIFKTTNM